MEQSRHKDVKELMQKDDAFLRITLLFRERNKKEKKGLFCIVNIHLLPIFLGICFEGRTQYATDSSKGCVKLVTPLDDTVEFLTHLGDLFRNFGIRRWGGQTSMD